MRRLRERERERKREVERSESLVAIDMRVVVARSLRFQSVFSHASQEDVHFYATRGRDGQRVPWELATRGLFEWGRQWRHVRSIFLPSLCLPLAHTCEAALAVAASARSRLATTASRMERAFDSPPA